MARVERQVQIVSPCPSGEELCEDESCSLDCSIVSALGMVDSVTDEIIVKFIPDGIGAVVLSHTTCIPDLTPLATAAAAEYLDNVELAASLKIAASQVSIEEPWKCFHG